MGKRRRRLKGRSFFFLPSSPTSTTSSLVKILGIPTLMVSWWDCLVDWSIDGRRCLDDSTRSDLPLLRSPSLPAYSPSTEPSSSDTVGAYHQHLLGEHKGFSLASLQRLFLHPSNRRTSSLSRFGSPNSTELSRPLLRGISFPLIQSPWIR